MYNKYQSMNLLCLSYNITEQQDIVSSQTPLLHLGLTLTGASSAILEPEACSGRQKAGADHAAQTLRDPSTPAPQHSLHGAPASAYFMFQDGSVNGPFLNWITFENLWIHRFDQRDKDKEKT